MKITVLAENTSAREDIGCEHGLSLYIETKYSRVLFDMGQTELFAENAKRLDIDLSRVDVAVVSHGHYDHGGGLARFLRENDSSPVYISRLAFGAHYNGREKYIGLDPSLKKSPRLVFTDEVKEIGRGLTLYPASSVKKLYPDIAHGLTEKRGESFVCDEFLHERYLLIEEDGRRVLISGCSHRGILNISGSFECDVIVGGFHFSKLPLDEVEGCAKKLGALKTQFFTCHCTGEAQFSRISDIAKNVIYVSSGQSVVI